MLDGLLLDFARGRVEEGGSGLSSEVGEDTEFRRGSESRR